MGQLNIPTQASPAWGDLAGYSQAQIAAIANRAWVLGTKLNHTTRGQQMIGFWPTTTLDSSPNFAVYTNSNFIRARAGANTGGREVAYSASTDYPIIVVWTPTGYQAFSKRGDDWYRDWCHSVIHSANYGGFSNYDAIGSLQDRFAIQSLKADLFAFDVDLESLEIGQGSYVGQAQMPAYEFYMQFDYDVEPTSGYIVFAYSFTTIAGSDYWYYFRIDSSSNLSWGQAVDGVYTDYYGNPDPIPTITPGSTIRIFVDWDGLRIFENETEVFNYDDTAAYYMNGDDTYYLNQDWSILDLGVDGEISHLKIAKRRLRDESGLGSDLVTNGGFAADTDWTKGSHWTIGSGVAHHAGDGITGSQLTESGATGLVEGKLYLGTIDIPAASAIGAGTTGVSLIAGNFGDTYYNAFVFIEALGSYSGRVWARATPNVAVYGQRSFVGDVDNVVVKEILFSPDALALVFESLLA